jgi:hypothetical protein
VTGRLGRRGRLRDVAQVRAVLRVWPQRPSVAADHRCIAARLAGNLELDCVGNRLLVVREDEEPGLALLAWYVDAYSEQAPDALSEQRPGRVEESAPVCDGHSPMDSRPRVPYQSTIRALTSDRSMPVPAMSRGRRASRARRALRRREP